MKVEQVREVYKQIRDAQICINRAIESFTGGGFTSEEVALFEDIQKVKLELGRVFLKNYSAFEKDK